MKILVIGAGWYGCHLATVLQRDGHTVTIVDRVNKIFAGSSSRNQNRLHLGYHYPRSLRTIQECQAGYPLFMSMYGSLTEDVSDNLYFIAERPESLITPPEFLSNIEAAGCSIEQTRDISQLPLPIQSVANPCLNTVERYINPRKAAAFFEEFLTITPLPSPEHFESVETILTSLGPGFAPDLILNCTYNHLEPIAYEHYELFLTLLYRIDTPRPFAYTLMDGPFFSIYPYDIENKIYTVTHVKHCILSKGRILPDVTPPADAIRACRQRVESDITSFIPSWESVSTFEGYYTSWKTKHDTQTDDRSVRHQLTGNVLSIYGGKITGIFHAEEIVRSHLATLTAPTC